MASDEDHEKQPDAHGSAESESVYVSDEGGRHLESLKQMPKGTVIESVSGPKSVKGSLPEQAQIALAIAREAMRRGELRRAKEAGPSVDALTAEQSLKMHQAQVDLDEALAELGNILPNQNSLQVELPGDAALLPNKIPMAATKGAWGMGYEALTAKARRHWAEWLPEKTRRLKEAGTFTTETKEAAVRAQKEIDSLMRQGYQLHEAEEVVLQEYILLKPEPGAEVSQEDAAELEQMEADYQAWAKPMFNPDPDEEE